MVQGDKSMGKLKTALINPLAKRVDELEHTVKSLKARVTLYGGRIRILEKKGWLKDPDAKKKKDA